MLLLNIKSLRIRIYLSEKTSLNAILKWSEIAQKQHVRDLIELYTNLSALD